jgi:predicted esterase
MAANRNGRIKSRPNDVKNLGSHTTGLRRTGLETERDGLLYVPESFNPKSKSPLVVMLHGSGGNAHHAIDPLKDIADHTGTILLAPESQGKTWDILLGGFGLDVYFIDEALSDVFALYPIDPERLAIGGFSDGASYALSLGLTNGDLFSHILAFSPGFSSPARMEGSPHIFMSHGVNDRVLPIERCSRALAKRLKEQGLDVTYQEFDGGHTIPTDVGRSAFDWFLGPEAIEAVSHARVRASEAGIERT